MVRIKIDVFEDKVSKTNKSYTRFKDSSGAWLTGWDEEVNKVIKANPGRFFDLEITENNGYKNIQSAVLVEGEVIQSGKAVTSDTQASITRAVAFKGAIEVNCALIKSGKSPIPIDEQMLSYLKVL